MVTLITVLCLSLVGLTTAHFDKTTIVVDDIRRKGEATLEVRIDEETKTTIYEFSAR